MERAIAAVAPQWASQRARSRALVMHYDAANVGRRASTLRADRTNADAAGRARQRIAFYARDMVRNTPFAARAQAVITGNVVGDGILPKITIVEVNGRKLKADIQKRLLRRGLDLIEKHLDSTAIDRQGRSNLYGLQRLVSNTVVDAGECLVRIYDGESEGLPLQLDVLEPDYIDESKVGFLDGGSQILSGIEYDGEGRRVAYWLYPEHPGGDWSPGTRRGISERVPAEQVMHIYRVDRPGQQRGISWFAPVMMRLQDLADHEDAQLMRQKIAACFTAFRVLGEGKGGEIPETMSPGMIYDLEDGEDIRFSAPPAVEGYDEFTRSVLRSVAAGMGVSYEALTGDLGQVNFSSARMGRLEMDSNISAWQWLMLMPQFLQPLGRHFLRAWSAIDEPQLIKDGIVEDLHSHIRLTWVPPRKIIVDPAREFAALREAVRSGFASRQQVVRQLGIDPERLLEEQAQDKAEADRLGLPFDSDPRADVSRQSKAEEPDSVSVSEAARALGVNPEDFRGLIEDLRMQEKRKHRK
ncbi:phage portal protein [Pseudogemmobacter faecipullorum]|uniref:Phage portal protein n=1 Tax=Pseudogemmobacter faecipullorum TaxID=2755041 RepID=A0ABS8CSK4_9RHOB|nr:phage portal protein [Pseudogemmobacter faecipullorum]MCB5412384.1 phage portal protein [Pseudogemmobacter faecipullorum]